MRARGNVTRTNGSLCSYLPHAPTPRPIGGDDPSPNHAHRHVSGDALPSHSSVTSLRRCGQKPNVLQCSEICGILHVGRPAMAPRQPPSRPSASAVAARIRSWSPTRGVASSWPCCEPIERRAFNSWPPARLAAAPNVLLPNVLLPAEACRCGLQGAEHRRAGCTAICVCLTTVVAVLSFIELGLYLVHPNELTPW
jgi:hypothetical protein